MGDKEKVAAPSSVSDLARTSWRLKLARADKHLEELEAKVREYGDSKPYEVRREPEGEPKKRRWAFVLHFTKKPDPELAVIMGDVIHNVRSALDHIAVAIAPYERRANAGFPILSVDPWALDANGQFATKNNDLRTRFEQQTRGMDARAVAIIKMLQPYARDAPDVIARVLRLADTKGGCDITSPDTHVLAILSRFDNADKHKKLIPIGGGLEDTVSTLSIGGFEEDRRTFELCQDGTAVHRFQIVRPITPEPEMKVDIRGTVRIAVRVGKPEGNADVMQVLRGLIERIPFTIFDPLEHFVRW